MSSSTLLLLFFIFATLATQAMSRTLHEVTIAEKYKQWMATYNRKYESKAEEEKHFKIFKNNLKYIESSNKGGNMSYELGLNAFADMTRDEFLATHTGYRMSPNPTKPLSSTPFRYGNFSDVPDSLDWREKGAVIPVKQQGRCGSCWAFSAVAAMEGITQIKTGNLISLSEQQLLDCTSDDDTCAGGLMNDAFEYVIGNKGITTQENYPYNGVKETCDTEKAKAVAATINSYERVPANSEEALLKAVTNQPISVAIEASESFQFYKNGVYTGPCGTELNHGVTIVGYGTSEEGTKYWLVKNSWGESWGENGYVKVKRDIVETGLCGIAMDATYPVA